MPTNASPSASEQTHAPAGSIQPVAPASVGDEALNAEADRPLLGLQDVRIGNRIQLSWHTTTGEGVRTSSRLVAVVPNPLLGGLPASYQRERNLDQSLLTFCVTPVPDAARPAEPGALPWMVAAECDDFTEKVTIRAVYQLTRI